MSGQPTRIASVSGLRGIIGNGLDPLIISSFAAAYAAGCEPGPILVGHDGRRSAPVFVPAVLASVTATGHDAIDLGPTATPTLGFLTRTLGAAGGIQISASHNPSEYNGLKCFQTGGMVLSPQQGRAWLDRIERQDFGWVAWDRLGRIRQLDDPFRSHLDAVLAVVDVEAIRRRQFKVVLDSCHGAGGPLGESLLDRLSCQVISIGGVPDGRYDRSPEPTEQSLKPLASIVAAVGADLGFAQDPDADRLALIDETGQALSEELTLALAASRRLDQARGPVVLNLSTSRVTEVLAESLGCPVHRSPVGEIHVVDQMRAVDAVLGGEGNGGVIDPRVGFVRDSFVGMALILDRLATDGRGRTLSALVAELPKFAMVKRKINRPQGLELQALWTRLRSSQAGAKFDDRDGLRMDWPEGWVHARASNTEPILRVIAEAPTLDQAAALADRVERSLGVGS